MSDAKADDGRRCLATFNSRSDANDFIIELPSILRELGVDGRFRVIPSPVLVIERQNKLNGRKYRYFKVFARDTKPGEPLPELTAADIAKAFYRARRKAKLPSLERRGRASASPANDYPASPIEVLAQQRDETSVPLSAFGLTQSITRWAELFDCSPAAIRRRLSAGVDLEAALTEIALQKSA